MTAFCTNQQLTVQILEEGSKDPCWVVRMAIVQVWGNNQFFIYYSVFTISLARILVIKKLTKSFLRFPIIIILLLCLLKPDNLTILHWVEREKSSSSRARKAYVSQNFAVMTSTPEAEKLMVKTLRKIIPHLSNDENEKVYFQREE